MAEILLIHGSGFAAWAFDRLIPELRALGLVARAMDLPGRDGAETSLQAQAEAIVAQLTGPTVLLGHSAAGFPITLAAVQAPNRVQGLIYLAAYVPEVGASLADLRRMGPSQPMRGAFQISPDRHSYCFDPARCRALFFHDTDDLSVRMGPEPIRPQETPFPGPLPNLPRAAIIARDDRAIPPDWQRTMARGMTQVELPSGHCPHLSMPGQLALTLHRLIATSFVAS